MLHNRRFGFAIKTFAVSALVWLSATSAFAQTPAALPTAPGADRTIGNAPATAAKASLRGDNGSPLEPYLFGFILVGGGLICAIGVRLSDRRVRVEHDHPVADVNSRLPFVRA